MRLGAFGGGILFLRGLREGTENGVGPIRMSFCLGWQALERMGRVAVKGLILSFLHARLGTPPGKIH